MLALGSAILGLAGCNNLMDAKPPPIYKDESFSAQNAFSRDFPASVRTTCEAARRALLSQGYVLKDSKVDQITGTKRFQPKGSTYTEIEFNVTCTPSSNDGDHAIAFANAIQNYYAIKRTANNASVGVGALGSLSLPVGSNDEALVRTGGETIPSGDFYERFFALTLHYLASIPEN